MSGVNVPFGAAEDVDGVRAHEVSLRPAHGSRAAADGASADAPQLWSDAFEARHIGPSASDVNHMLEVLSGADRKFSSLDEFSDYVVPEQIRLKGEFHVSNCATPLSEMRALQELRSIAGKNKLFRSLIGTGYYGTFTPPVIQRNILENPGWYTQYTPYQPEISQGRLEALLNFQTMVSDLTALPVANASLLDEGTAAAEAMSVSLAKYPHAENDQKSLCFLISERCHPQTIAVVQTRAEALAVRTLLIDERSFAWEQLPVVDGAQPKIFGALIQYPATDGSVEDQRAFAAKVHDAGALLTVATDLLALALLKPPGEWGADIAVGSAQRFGVPPGYGGPHAAFFAVSDDLKRLIPGRLIGVSKDAQGKPALRLSLQTREQHIRREKATSNICTAQVLLAVMASMYAVYHGPKRLAAIAGRVHALTSILAAELKAAGLSVSPENFFDTLKITFSSAEEALAVHARARKQEINVRSFDARSIGISLDELSTPEEVTKLIALCTGVEARSSETNAPRAGIPDSLRRKSPFLTQPVFNRYHSETEFLRYLKLLEARDLSLAVSMIPLGSCTMKLNATSEMLPVTWEEFGSLHPFVPLDQAKGYQQVFKDLEQNLKDITGFAAVSLQPNSGAQGEYAGLLAIRAYHKSRGEDNRTVCLIPRSAHGTNPASAVMAGFKVVIVECDSQGNIDVNDLASKARAHAATLAALMVTYPSTHGVFEDRIKEICRTVHSCGGQVYMDGANLNALVGLCRPSDIGADVCHINLHKTFCIPHGGGGPGMGPIAVKRHLQPFLPGHPLVDLKRAQTVGPVSAAPWGSASILVISWMYMRMMGASGLRRASQVAILSANYIAKRLEGHFAVLYRGKSGFVAHECILDLRELKASAGIEVDDVAKRLMDYGFHAPTVSWPVAGTLMVEPTESESKAELDRFCDALIAIREEARAVAEGRLDRQSNPLKGAPHTAVVVNDPDWNRPYSREQAAFPAAWTKEGKFWPSVGRVDAAYGDRNLVCTCSGFESVGKP